MPVNVFYKHIAPMAPETAEFANRIKDACAREGFLTIKSME